MVYSCCCCCDKLDKKSRVEALKDINIAFDLSLFGKDANFMSSVVTINKSVVHSYPETKQKSQEWRLSGSPRSNKFRGKVLAPDF